MNDIKRFNLTISSTSYIFHETYVNLKVRLLTASIYEYVREKSNIIMRLKSEDSGFVERLGLRPKNCCG